ncbi:MAG: hypothetical protein Q8K89_00010, partial [Actinomycetota bacterium]|nr:hypothetical protein [Actinomycetota bacterium]
NMGGFSANDGAIDDQSPIPLATGGPYVHGTASDVFDTNPDSEGAALSSLTSRMAASIRLPAASLAGKPSHALLLENDTIADGPKGLAVKYNTGVRLLAMPGWDRARFYAKASLRFSDGTTLAPSPTNYIAGKESRTVETTMAGRPARLVYPGEQYSEVYGGRLLTEPHVGFLDGEVHYILWAPYGGKIGVEELQAIAESILVQLEK